jgi:hypothetical protein
VVGMIDENVTAIAALVFALLIVIGIYTMYFVYGPEAFQ